MSRSFFARVVTVIVLLIIAGSMGFAASSYAVEPISIVINGKEVTSDVSPEVNNNRVLVPIRVISEGLGAQVIWDEENNQVLVNSSEVTYNTGTGTDISIVINGKKVDSDVPPIVKDNRVLVPIRVISENLGAQVDWDGDNNQVVIKKDMIKEITDNINNISIFGQSVATSAQLKALLKANNPYAPDLVDLYLNIGREYGIRGDIAFCQAAKETGWWRFGGLVQPEQNNYCGLGTTGRPNTGELNGADPTRVSFVIGGYGGAYFDTPATGVEAQIQHLYAYACTDDLPTDKVRLDPRFALVKRGCAPNWVDLGGKWAYPGYDKSKYASLEEAFANGETYGHSILTDYYIKAF